LSTISCSSELTKQAYEAFDIWASSNLNGCTSSSSSSSSTKTKVPKRIRKPPIQYVPEPFKQSRNTKPKKDPRKVKLPPKKSKPKLQRKLKAAESSSEDGDDGDDDDDEEEKEEGSGEREKRLASAIVAELQHNFELQRAIPQQQFPSQLVQAIPQQQYPN
jgi:hypothetical protein